MLAFALVAAADGGAVLTCTVKFSVRLGKPKGDISAVTSTEPALVGWKSAVDAPVLSVDALTAGRPVGATTAIDLVDLVEVLAVEIALVVVALDAFDDAGADTTSPPLDTFQYTGAPTRGDPSSIALTDMTADWFVKIFVGPPVIVCELGYERKVITIEAVERPGVESVSVVFPGTFATRGNDA